MNAKGEMAIRLLVPLLIGALALSAAGCGSNSSAALTITQFGPDNTKVGTPFNVQPNGDSAIWIKTDIVLESNAVISIDGIPLKSTVVGNLITAAIPPEVFGKLGTHSIAISENKGGATVTSNTVNFVVHD